MKKHFFSALIFSASFLLTLLLTTFPILIFSQKTSLAQGQTTSAISGMLMSATMLASMKNAETGSTLLAECKSKPMAIALCLMSAMSFVQSAASLFSAKQAKEVSKAASGSNNWDADWRGMDIGNGMTGAQFDSQFTKTEQQLEQAKKDLLAKGIDIEKGTVQTPKGVKGLDQVASSGKAMADAGLISAEQIEDVDKMLAQQKDAFKNITLNSSTGGGGGGGRLTSSMSYDLPSYDYDSLFGDKQKPNEPKTAGLVKMVNGEPIGGSTGNIFDMLHNRYQIKNREKIFVE